MAGLSSAGKDFADRLGKLSTAIEKGQADTVRAAALKAKNAQLDVMRPHSGGDLRLSGVNRAKGRQGNTKIGARFDIKSSGRKVRAEVKATGPVQLIANDTAGRVIRSAYAKGRSRKGFVGPTAGGQFRGDRRAVLNIPGIGFRRSVRHPGTRGKDTWRKGRKGAEPKVTRVMRQETANIVKRGFG
jgi:hypothetical protein